MYLISLHCTYKLFRYYLRNDAEDAIRFINGTRLDDRIVRTDWDAGFIEGRQYGRGKTGGQVRIFLHIKSIVYQHIQLVYQVRDEYRTDFDGGRGGWGKMIQQKVAASAANN